MPATPTPRTSPPPAPAAVSTAGINSHALRHHVAGSSSAQPACGVDNVTGRDSPAMTPRPGSTTTHLVAVVPMSSPSSSSLMAF
jgi:hypothetical protein